MLVKSGKYYADWYDEAGHRRRKAFPTAELATAHSTRMRAANRPQQPRRKSKTSSRPPSANPKAPTKAHAQPSPVSSAGNAAGRKRTRSPRKTSKR